MYGALEIATGQAFTLWMPGVDLGITRTFLEQLAESESEPDAEHIVIWDGAGFHQKTGTHALPPHIHEREESGVRTLRARFLLSTFP